MILSEGISLVFTITRDQPVEAMVLSKRKQSIRELSDALAPMRDRWIARNRYFHESDFRYMRFLIPEESNVLDLGCSTGRLLSELRPKRGVGIDISDRMIKIAQRNYPAYEFYQGDVEDKTFIETIQGPFDYIILSDTIGSLDDCESTLQQLHPLCTPETRIVISYYSALWEPILVFGELVKLRMRQAKQNWLSTDDIMNILFLAGYETIKREWRQLIPRRLLGLGSLINRYLAPLAIIRRLCLRNYIVARPTTGAIDRLHSASIIIPCRNEKGNIETTVQRIPRFCGSCEIIFVEGHSDDGTLDEIYRIIDKYMEKEIRVFVQDGKGKGDAVRKGCANARGDILIILDADLTVPPEALPKFYDAIISRKGEFVNGTRLVYPIEKDSMRWLNFIANRMFSLMFSWLLNQRFTDTLCGSKALPRIYYNKIAQNRSYFGEFDPFGDFDLIFGAAKLNMKIVEIPIKYAQRTYGETQISRFRHGWLLLRMVAFALKKFKMF